MAIFKIGVRTPGNDGLYSVFIRVTHNRVARYITTNISRNTVSHPQQAIRQMLFTFPLMMHYGFVGAILASVVISLYDGTRGNIKGAVAKYSFYAFYPLHLFTFVIVTRWCFVN